MGFEICELDRGHIVGAHSIQHTLHIVGADTQHRGRPTAFKHRTHQLFVNICRAHKHTHKAPARGEQIILAILLIFLILVLLLMMIDDMM